jgi:hypothetical protein
MRGSKVQGRFKVDFEHLSINEGIVDELRDPVGSTVNWYLWDAQFFEDHPEEVIDDIYDVSSQVPGQGRKWKNPFELPVIMAQQIRGTNVMNERGFYTTDTLRLVISVADVERLLPALMNNPNVHIRDRIVFQGQAFVPTRVLPRGRYANNYAVVTVDCNQVNSEELVNDSQFQDLVDAPVPPQGSISPGGIGDSIDGGSPTTVTFDSLLSSGQIQG